MKIKLNNQTHKNTIKNSSVFVYIQTKWGFGILKIDLLFAPSSFQEVAFEERKNGKLRKNFCQLQNRETY
jgi:hypothetical protein